jgi:hypothetical protein
MSGLSPARLVPRPYREGLLFQALARRATSGRSLAGRLGGMVTAMRHPAAGRPRDARGRWRAWGFRQFTREG